MKVCSICGKEYEGFGNNSWPLKREQCCYMCNNNVLIPLRLYFAGTVKNQILCINEDGECVFMFVNKEDILDVLQELVKGYIEMYPKQDRHFHYVVNEEGLLKHMKYNALVKELLDIDVVGPLVVVPKHLFK